MPNVFAKSASYAESYITFRAELPFAFTSVQYTKDEVLKKMDHHRAVVAFFENCEGHWIVSTRPRGYIDGNSWKLLKRRDERAMACNLLSTVTDLHAKHVRGLKWRVCSLVASRLCACLAPF